MTKTKQIQIRVPSELKQWLELQAQKKGVPIATWIAQNLA